MLDRVFEQLQREGIVKVKLEVVCMDSTSVKVHPDGTGAFEKTGPQSIGKSRGGWNTKLHMVASDDRTPVVFSLSPGQAHDAPEGRKLLRQLGPQQGNPSLVMDRVYSGDETRRVAFELGFTPVVPPLKSRVSPWKYDRELYKRRNEVERLFRRLKAYRRVFTRYDKLDVVYLGFVRVRDHLRYPA